MFGIGISPLSKILAFKRLTFFRSKKKKIANEMQQGRCRGLSRAHLYFLPCVRARGARTLFYSLGVSHSCSHSTKYISWKSILGRKTSGTDYVHCAEVWNQIMAHIRRIVTRNRKRNSLFWSPCRNQNVSTATDKNHHSTSASPLK